MESNPLVDSRYAFHQLEVRSLRLARDCTLEAWLNLRFLQEFLVKDAPSSAEFPIAEILNDGNHLVERLDSVEHLHLQVARPFKVPTCRALGKGPHDGNSEVHEVRSSHRAVWELHSVVHNLLLGIWLDANSGNFLPEDFEKASCDIVRSRWQQVREQLSELASFDFSGLKRAVECESLAAIERSRQSLAGRQELGPTISNILDLEKSIPQLGENREKHWVQAASSEMTSTFGLMSTTLRTARSKGEKNPTRTFGRDQQGRIWRVDPSNDKVIWYYKNSLKIKK